MPTARTLLGVLMAVLVVSAGAGAPVAAQSDADGGVLTEEIRDRATWSGIESGDDVITYGVDAHPGWIVSYDAEDNGSAALQSWINDSSERSLISEGSGNWSVISAPASDVGATRYQQLLGSITGSTLSDAGYIESIGLNLRVERVEPVQSLDNSSAYETPAWGSAATLGGIRGEFTPEGVAHSEDANLTTMGDARGYVSAGDGATGDGVRVAVVDTGLNFDERLYGERVVAAKNTLSNRTANITLDGDGSVNLTESDYEAVADGNLHGSFVTSQIGANSSNSTYDGVAPDAELISVKALGDDGSGSTASIARGIDYAAAQGADVISLSLGSYVPQPIIQEEMEEAYSEDDVSAIVVAVGNSRTSVRWVASPADAQDLPVISVAASNGEPAAEAESAYFSNVGPDPTAQGATPTVAAPGMRIQAQLDTGTSIDTRTLSGTSMATPIVSGVVAQVLQEDSSIRGDEHNITERIKDTASPMPRAGSTEVGAGMVNSSRALSNELPAETQEQARTEDARARDSANEALSGSLLRQLLGGGDN